MEVSEVCLVAIQVAMVVVWVVSRVAERWVPVVASCSGVVSQAPSLVLHR